MTSYTKKVIFSFLLLLGVASQSQNLYGMEYFRSGFESISTLIKSGIKYLKNTLSFIFDSESPEEDFVEDVVELSSESASEPAPEPAPEVSDDFKILPLPPQVSDNVESSEVSSHPRDLEVQPFDSMSEQSEQEEDDELDLDSYVIQYGKLGPAFPDDMPAEAISRFFRKKDEEGVGKKDVYVGGYKIPCKYVMHDNKELIQLDVLSQMVDYGGGGASCGYHTIKNAFLTVFSLLGQGMPDLIANVSEREIGLNNPLIAILLFGDIEARWRKQVILMRKADYLSSLLKPLFVRSVRSLDDILLPDSSSANGLNIEKVRDFFVNGLNDFSAQIAHAAIFRESLENIVTFFEKRCRKIMNVRQYYVRGHRGSINDLERSMCTQIVINAFIDLEHIEALIALTLDNYGSVIPEDEVIRMVGNDGDFSGALIDGDEMKRLIKIESESRTGLFDRIKEDVTWLVYEDISLMGNSGFDANESKLRHVAQKTVSDPNHKVVFCIGTMSNSRFGSIGGTDGHWFPLIWSNDRCYTMDSLDNQSRLKDERVLHVLNIFERMRRDITEAERE